MEVPEVVTISSLFDECHLLTGVKKKVLLVVDELMTPKDLSGILIFLSDKADIKFVHLEHVDKEPKSSYDAVLSGIAGNFVEYDLDMFSLYIQLLTPGGQVIAKTELGSEEKTMKLMKTCGFLEVFASVIPGVVFGKTPLYKIGSSDKVTLNSEIKENVLSAWKSGDNNSETISEDDLLEAEDLEKPESASLRVCATTKKAKACKNCSCGLAEELEANRSEKASKPDTSNAKSSCGNCYLGDAFRCASCPYKGLPAFKPGEKIQLAGTWLEDDF